MKYLKFKSPCTLEHCKVKILLKNYSYEFWLRYLRQILSSEQYLQFSYLKNRIICISTRHTHCGSSCMFLIRTSAYYLFFDIISTDINCSYTRGSILLFTGNVTIILASIYIGIFIIYLATAATVDRKYLNYIYCRYKYTFRLSFCSIAPRYRAIWGY